MSQVWTRVSVVTNAASIRPNGISPPGPFTGLSSASQTSTTASRAAMAALSTADRLATAGWMRRDGLRNATGGAAACPAGREDAADGGPTSPAGRAGVMDSGPRLTSRGVDGSGPAVTPESPPEAEGEGSTLNTPASGFSKVTSKVGDTGSGAAGVVAVGAG